MDMNSTLARVATGLAVRLIAAGLALYLALTVVDYVSRVFSTIHGVL